MRPKITVAMTVFNEERRVEYAIKTATWADEILVVDSGSTDGTIEICKRYTNRIIHQDWLGYSKQKLFSIEKASHDWVFILDQDEEISNKLIQEIENIPDKLWDKCPGFCIPRKNYIARQYIRCFNPDYICRLINRDRIEPRTCEIHGGFDAKKGEFVKLKGHLEHNRHAPFDMKDFFNFKDMDYRLGITVSQMMQEGRKAGFIEMAFRPVFDFFKWYILKGAIFDGAFGFLISVRGALFPFYKYSELYLLRKFNQEQPLNNVQADQAQAKAKGEGKPEK